MYNGAHFIGRIVELKRRAHAWTAAGVSLGTFASRKAAFSAISANARSP